MSVDAKMARTSKLAMKLIEATLSLIHENGGEMSRKDLLKALPERVKFDAWELDVSPKRGRIRWQYVLGFFSIGFIKAGYLLKNKGVWYITPEGVQALKKKGDVELLESVKVAYRRWADQRPVEIEVDDLEDGTESEEKQILVLDEIEQLASESLENAINAKGPYEFQELVAALLRGMGYFTPFVAPKGKDGGIDVIAYGDPLGTKAPRIKVQVKHRENTASVKEVRELVGVLQKEGEVGIFVSSGGFGPDAKSAAVNSHVHIELIDLPRFINLWRDFYDKLEEADKALLPLRGVYFHAPSGG